MNQAVRPTVMLDPWVRIKVDAASDPHRGGDWVKSASIKLSDPGADEISGSESRLMRRLTQSVPAIGSNLHESSCQTQARTKSLGQNQG